MTQPAKGHEPSMDEILASIRRIIADEDPAKGPALATGAEAAGLQSSSAPAAPPHAAETTMPPEAEINAMIARLQATASRQAPTDPAVAEADVVEVSEQREAERGLMSAATSAAVGSAFNALAQTAQAQNPRTLEDLVREMLRPMLKSWLDDNLPSVVERLVRAEIERVARHPR
jgi:uncharacterized protein